MSLSASDIKIYQAVNHAENDTDPQGGAIDVSGVIVFDSGTLANALNDTIDVVSTSGSDNTQTVTVYGRNAGGSIVSENFALTGTSQVVGSTTFERIMKVVVDATFSGNIEIHANSTSDVIMTLLGSAAAPNGVAELSVKRLYYAATANTIGGETKNFYEKIFIKNNHTTLSLLGAAVVESADPAGLIVFDLEDAVNDNNSTANRVSAPAGMLGSFDGASKNVPGVDLAAGSAIGCWLRMTLPGGTSAGVNTYTLSISGSSI
jgi:hypothetical protein